MPPNSPASALEPIVAGQAGSPDALRRLREAIAGLKTLSVEPLLRRSVAAIQSENAQEAAEWAIKALQRDEQCGMAWYCLAIAREKAGDFKTSVQCYEAALQLSPEHDEITSNLARLAYRMGMKEKGDAMKEKLKN